MRFSAMRFRPTPVCFCSAFITHFKVCFTGKRGAYVLPAQGGIFALLDCRSLLKEPTFEAERELWLHFLNNANVNMTPGKTMRFEEPGFFRCVYGSVSSDELIVACDRMKKALEQ